MIILDAKTGFCITKTARKDIVEAANQGTEKAVHAVFANWQKLLGLNMIKGKKRAQQDAVAASQKLYFEEMARRQIKIAKMIEEGTYKEKPTVDAQLA